MASSRVIRVWLCVALCVGACRLEPPAPRRVAVPPRPSAPASDDRCAPAALRLVESVPTATELGASPLARTHQVWLELVESAQESLDIEQFYVESTPSGRLEPVLEAIERAQGRGVRVRIIADAGFARTYPQSLERLGKRAEVRRFEVSRVMGGVQHAKFFVVDACETYLGSANFDWRSLEHIHELGVAVREPAIAAALLAAFEMDWSLAASDRPATGGDGPRPALLATPRGIGAGVWAMPLFSPRDHLPMDNTWELPALVSAIDRAQRSVRVALLSYETRFRNGQPFDDLDAALRRAGRRGVKVELYVSHWDTRAGRIDALKELATVPGVAVKIVTIPEHPSGFIPYARVVHAKYMVVDAEESWIGTSNWGGDYFFHSRNVGLWLEGTSVAAEVERVHARLFHGRYAELVEPNREYPPPRIGE